jgi:hypothetical protein
MKAQVWLESSSEKGESDRSLAEKKAGDSLDIIGPLGNCFPLPENDTTPILIAGGIGLGPILFLHSVLRLGGYTPLLIVGFRTKSAIPFAVCTVRYCFLHRRRYYRIPRDCRGIPQNCLFACESGALRLRTEGLLRSVEGLAERSHISCWISMEQVMACRSRSLHGCVIRSSEETGLPGLH